MRGAERGRSGSQEPTATCLTACGLNSKTSLGRHDKMFESKDDLLM